MVSTETIRRYPPSRDYLIPMLQAVQEQVCRGTACLEACSSAPVMTVREIKVRELRA